MTAEDGHGAAPTRARSDFFRLAPVASALVAAAFATPVLATLAPWALALRALALSVGALTGISLEVAQAGAAPPPSSTDRQGAQGVRHWAFEAIHRPSVPLADDQGWARTPIDEFVFSKLAAHDLSPSPQASPTTLLRRLTLDLVGLPPESVDVDAFVADPSDAAYLRAVDRLLENPHFGERWGRHWLDAARHADSAGYEFDGKRETWRYRDWVVKSLNDDKPLDQFLIEQIAGDLIPNATQDQLIATGFSCNALEQYGDFHETNIDRVNAYGTAVLGLTLGCARCHDHKLDPITQEEYFRLYAFFNAADDASLNLSAPEAAAVHDALAQQAAALKKELFLYQNGPDKDPSAWAAQMTQDEIRSVSTELREAIVRLGADRTPEQVERIRHAHAAAVAAFQRRLDDRIAAWNAQLTSEQRQQMGSEAAAYLSSPPGAWREARPPAVVAKFWEQDAGRVRRAEVIAELEKKIPPLQTTLVMSRRDAGPTRIFLRGDHRQLGPEVTPGVPAALEPQGAFGPQSNRLDLAKWSVARDNPLTARVQVNRIWQALFGIGLVETSDNLGTATPRPEYADLLDWLAAELMDNQWRLKHVVRLIAASSVYRQDSCVRADLDAADPTNRLLGRQRRLRLEAETIRDGALAVSGLLDRTLGGPSVFPYQPEGVMAGRADGASWGVSDASNRYRRGLYTHFWRLTPHPFLIMFDAPDATESCTRRSRSNTPIQALTLLNDPTFVEAAVALAKRLIGEPSRDAAAERIRWGVKTCYGREADAEEIAVLENLARLAEQELASDPMRARRVASVSEDVGDLDAVALAQWTSVARALLNTDEFITRE